MTTELEQLGSTYKALIEALKTHIRLLQGELKTYKAIVRTDDSLLKVLRERIRNLEDERGVK